MEASVFELADQFKALKDKKKAMETAIKDLNRQIEQTQLQLLESMINEEVGKFDRSGFTFYSSSRVHVSVKAGCKPHVIEWLKDTEYNSMVKEDVNAKTLEAWAREYIDQNDELPAEIQDYINRFEKQTVSIRKTK